MRDPIVGCWRSCGRHCGNSQSQTPRRNRAVYDQHRRADEKRAALQRWSRILTAIIERKSAANVIELRGQGHG